MSVLTFALAAALAAPPPDPEDCYQEVTAHDTNECLAQAYGATWTENFGDCFAASTLQPCDGEERHWDATWIDVAQDETVLNIRYYLFHGESNSGLDCDASIEHDVALYVANQDTPDADPTVIEQWTVQAYSTPANGIVFFEQPLTNTYTVGNGEYLFVSVQYAGEVDPGTLGTCSSGGPIICQSTCPSDGSDAASYWSNATDPDFNWQDLEDFNIFAVPRVGARSYTSP